MRRLYGTEIEKPLHSRPLLGPAKNLLKSEILLPDMPDPCDLKLLLLVLLYGLFCGPG